MAILPVYSVQGSEDGLRDIHEIQYIISVIQIFPRFFDRREATLVLGECYFRTAAGAKRL